MFRSAENFADNSAFFQKLFELNNDRFDEIFSFLDFLVNVCYEIFIAFGIEVFEAQIFEFAFYLRNAETPCKRRKNFKRFFRNTLLSFLRQKIERAHIVKPVGKFDYNHPDVVCHSHENFSEIFGVLLLVRGKLNFVEFGHAVYKRKYLRAEEFAHVLAGCGSVLYNVVQKSRRNGRRIHTQIYEYLCNGAGMRKIRLARGAFLPLVHLLRIAVSRTQQFPVAFGIVF